MTRMKRCLLFLLCLIQVFLLTSCAQETSKVPGEVSMPEITSPYAAPEDMSGMEKEEQLSFYLPSSLPTQNTSRLLASHSTVSFPYGEDPSQRVIQTLFSLPADENHLRLGEGRLHLMSRSPVEVSGTVCTVNLESGALNLDSRELYTSALSIASTLGAYNGVRTVNLLIQDRAIGMDLAENLPMGSVSPVSGMNAGMLYDQLMAQATPLGADPARTMLSGTATLYFPLNGQEGLVPEVQTLTFYGQSPQQLAMGLLDALSMGARSLPDAASMPDLTDLLSDSIEVTELAGGGRLITLRFLSELENRFGLAGLDPASAVGAIVMTLTSYIPSVGAVRIFSGSTLMTSVRSEEMGVLTFQDGLQRRRQWAPLVRQSATIYLARDGRLCEATRYVSATEVTDLPRLTSLLSKGPTVLEASEGIERTLPAGLDETDILGMSISGDTLLVNLSPRFGWSIQQSSDREMLLCYSLVLTYCEAHHLHRIRFFVDGQMQEDLGGEINWGGEFIVNHSLLDQNRG